MTSTMSDLAPLMTSLVSEYSGVTASLATASGKLHQISLSRSSATLAASIMLVSNEEILQTATEATVINSANSAVAQASYLLSSLYEADNLYGMYPSYGGNMAMAIIMGIFMGIHTVLGCWAQQWWFVICFFAGTGLEMAGYIGRTLSADDVVNLDYFLVQIICLTIAPAFLMGGIYYLLAELVVIYGTDFAALKPLQYAYTFLTCDIISLIIQAAGGGIAAEALTMYESPDAGTHVMVAGIAFQVVSMSVFTVFFVHFLRKIKYGTKEHRQLEPFFNPEYEQLRKRWLFRIFPLIISIGVACVYVRCVYRVIELAEGWSGYLITHEVYFMILDGLMMALTCFVLVFFHPGIVYSGDRIKVHKGSFMRYFKFRKMRQSRTLSKEQQHIGRSVESKLGFGDENTTEMNYSGNKELNVGHSDDYKFTFDDENTEINYSNKTLQENKPK